MDSSNLRDFNDLVTFLDAVGGSSHLEAYSTPNYDVEANDSEGALKILLDEIAWLLSTKEDPAAVCLTFERDVHHYPIRGHNKFRIACTDPTLGRRIGVLQYILDLMTTSEYEFSRILGHIAGALLTLHWPNVESWILGMMSDLPREPAMSRKLIDGCLRRLLVAGRNQDQNYDQNKWTPVISELRELVDELIPEKLPGGFKYYFTRISSVLTRGTEMIKFARKYQLGRATKFAKHFILMEKPPCLHFKGKNGSSSTVPIAMIPEELRSHPSLPKILDAVDITAKMNLEHRLVHPETQLAAFCDRLGLLRIGDSDKKFGPSILFIGSSGPCCMSCQLLLKSRGYSFSTASQNWDPKWSLPAIEDPGWEDWAATFYRDEITAIADQMRRDINLRLEDYLQAFTESDPTVTQDGASTIGEVLTPKSYISRAAETENLATPTADSVERGIADLVKRLSAISHREYKDSSTQTSEVPKQVTMWCLEYANETSQGDKE